MTEGRRSAASRARKLRAVHHLARDLPRRRAHRRHLRPHRHDQQVVRRDLQRVAEGARTSAITRAAGRGDPGRHAAARSRRACSTGCGRWTACEAAGGIFRSAASWTRRATRSATASRPNFISSLQPEAVRDAQLRARAARRERRPRPRSTRRRPTAGTSKIGDTLRHRRRDEAQDVPDRRHPAKLGDTSSGGAGIAQLTLPEAQRITDKEGEFDGISVGRRRGVSPEQLRRADRRRCMPPPVLVETGDAGGQAPVAGHQGQPQVPPDRAARVRRRGAVRRRLPDLQHVLDHGRPAHPRVRDAAHAGRVARARSSRTVVLEALMHRRCSARRSGCSRGIGFAYGAQRALQGFGIDLPNTGTVIETRTVIVSLRRRHGRDAGRRADAGAARHARLADGGAARGRAADRAARPRACWSSRSACSARSGSR